MYCQTKCKVCPSIADGKAVVRGLTLAPARLATVAQPLLAASHPVGVIETARVNGVADGRVTDGISAVFVKRVVLHLLRRPTTLQEQVLAPCVELRVVEFVRTAAGFAPVLVVFLRLIWVVSLAATVAVDFPRNGGLAPPQLGDAPGMRLYEYRYITRFSPYKSRPDGRLFAVALRVGASGRYFHSVGGANGICAAAVVIRHAHARTGPEPYGFHVVRVIRQ